MGGEFEVELAGLGRERLRIICGGEGGGGEAILAFKLAGEMGKLLETQVESDGFDRKLFFKQIGGENQAPMVQPVARAGFKKLPGVAAELPRGDAEFASELGGMIGAAMCHRQPLVQIIQV